MGKKKPRTKQEMDRFPKVYSVDEVFAWVKTNKGILDAPKRAEMDGHTIKIKSLRYETFMAKGTTCCACGIEGTKFYKERNFTVNGQPTTENGNFHLNLYAVNDTGEEVLMTKDHILAHHLGGSDCVDNMQTMCTVCNGKKGTMTIDQWEHYLKTGKYAEGYIP